MIRDILRAALAVAVMTAAAGLLLEVRYSLAAIDLAHRQAAHQSPTFAPGPGFAPGAAPAPQPPGRLRQVGRAALDLADAALGVVR